MGRLRFVSAALFLCLIVVTDANAGNRRRGCYVPAACQVAPACCPQPAIATPSCTTCTPAATCCQPPAASALRCRVEGDICPCFPCMLWGGYTSYYAVVCDAATEAVMLDAANDLTIGDPPCRGPHCVPGARIDFLKQHGAPHHHHPTELLKPKLTNKRTHEQAIDYWPNPEFDYVHLDPAIGKLGYFRAKTNGGAASTVYVQLRRISVTPKAGHNNEGQDITFKIGQQIEDPKLPNLNDLNGKVKFNDKNPHVVLITLFGVEYQVITHDQVSAP